MNLADTIKKILVTSQHNNCSFGTQNKSDIVFHSQNPIIRIIFLTNTRAHVLEHVCGVNKSFDSGLYKRLNCKTSIVLCFTDLTDTSSVLCLSGCFPPSFRSSTAIDVVVKFSSNLIHTEQLYHPDLSIAFVLIQCALKCFGATGNWQFSHASLIAADHCRRK